MASSPEQDNKMPDFTHLEGVGRFDGEDDASFMDILRHNVMRVQGHQRVSRALEA